VIDDYLDEQKTRRVLEPDENLWEVQEESKISVINHGQTGGLIQKPKTIAKSQWASTMTDYHNTGTSIFAAQKLVSIMRAFPALEERMISQIYSQLKEHVGETMQYLHEVFPDAYNAESDETLYRERE
jgi:hypothetical protein